VLQLMVGVIKAGRQHQATASVGFAVSSLQGDAMPSSNPYVGAEGIAQIE
jgi:hypothetical protein